MIKTHWMGWIMIGFSLILIGYGVAIVTKELEPIEEVIMPEVIEEELPVMFNVNGFVCWLDANPDFDYTGNQTNVVIGVTCPVEAMFPYLPAAED